MERSRSGLQASCSGGTVDKTRERFAGLVVDCASLYKHDDGDSEVVTI